MRILNPTENKRFNEMIGFVCLVAGVLLALSLLSYSPQDASFNVAAAAPISGPARNWIGPFGAHLADLLFQFCGYGAFLIPAAIFIFGMRWFRSHAIASPIAKIVGATMMFLFLPAQLALLRFPDVRGAIPAGGLLGTVLASGLRGALNPVGANLVGIACVLTALFLTTRFSFSAAAEWLRAPMGAEGYLGRMVVRLKDWREERESMRLRRRMEEIKVSGRRAAPAQAVSSRDAAVAAEVEPEEDSEPENSSRMPTVIKFRDSEIAPAKLKAAAEPKIAKGKTSYRLPSTSLLRPPEHGEKMDEGELKDYARAIVQKSEEFDVKGHITQINPGPVVTTFEFKPEAGIKYSRITGLAEDLCLALRAESLLIERIPGKSTVGIEVPNPHRETIALREVIESPEFVHSASKLTMPLGKDLIGRIRVADLTQMPHLLIAGSTGTGKSVFINSLLMGMLYTATPEELKLVLVDPKRLELGLYEDIPHLFTPVVTDAKVASNVLRNATREMERRLKLLAQRGVRNIEQYNRTFEKNRSLSLFDSVEEEEHKPLPYIVIVI
ncbi:MAG: DNA translocase FtsK 4TM domain-containing protein, partial [Candidatus Acidiferrales bacterium]